ncbi:MAG: SDR family NAD(P)-dependent oxidoreductase [Alphaproteobacteria bacterium]|nr:SDR family NAD(P)-dependent oxidoreductase [Alphaproteobacteria bacterium]
MKDLRDKVAFITGGASGLGLSMARAFGREGMKVMIADIEENALERAVKELNASQVRAEGVLCDVADRNSVRNGALKTISAFGKVHVVCNNAGVAVGGPIGEVNEKDWQWIVDVNLLGVVYGMETFVPLIESHGEGGHFINTASMAGMISPPNLEPYCATKFAVVAMSEGWNAQLAPKNIGVSVLCPGFVQTRIHESERNKPQRYGNPATVHSALGTGRESAAQLVQSGIPVEPVGNRVVEAIKDNDLYIFTHVELKPFVEMRFANILAAFDKSSASKALSVLPKRDPATMMQQMQEQQTAASAQRK